MEVSLEEIEQRLDERLKEILELERELEILEKEKEDE